MTSDTRTRVVDHVPLSAALAEAIQIAHRHEKRELATWARRELAGYLAGTAGFIGQTVPRYRAVGGYWLRADGSALDLSESFEEVNELRLREPVEELEAMALTSAPTLHVAPGPQLGVMRRNIDPAVTSFVFNPRAIVGVLAAIRSELRERMTTAGVASEFMRRRSHVGAARRAIWFSAALALLGGGATVMPLQNRWLGLGMLVAGTAVMAGLGVHTLRYRRSS